MFYLNKYSSKLSRYGIKQHVSKCICITLVKLEVFIQTGQVQYSTARLKIYLFHTGEARSVSASGTYVIFLQFVAHWNFNL